MLKYSQAAVFPVFVFQGPEKQHEQLAVHRELLCQPTQSPVPYLSTAIDAMLQQLATLQATRRNLESIVPLDGRANGSPAPAASLQNLPEVLRGLNDYFLHIAAHVARLRDTAASMRADFLRARAATGNFFDPFKDADQREAELAAAKKSNSSPMQLDTGATVAPPVALQPASVPAQAEPLALPAPSGAGACDAKPTNDRMFDTPLRHGEPNRSFPDGSALMHTQCIV
jgi:hypothetical protein